MNYRRNEDKWPFYEGAVNYNNVIGKEITETGGEPVTLAEVKKQLIIDEADTAHDSYLAILMQAAREAVENFTHSSIVEKDIVLTVENVRHGFTLPYGPVTSVASVMNEDEAITEIDYSEGYEQVIFDGSTDFSLGKATFSYSVGYTTVPAALKLAILEEIAYRYEHRGDQPGLGPIAKGYSKSYKRNSWLA